MKEKKKNPISRAFSSFGNAFLRLFGVKKKQEEKDILKEEAIQSPSRMVIKNFFKNPLGVIGLVGFIGIFLFVFIGQMVVPYDPYYQQGSMKNIAPGYGYMDIPQQLLDEGVVDIQSGITFSAGLSKAGKVYTWGHDPGDDIKMPEDIAEKLKTDKPVQIAVGDRHILVLTDKDEILGWGNNAFDQTVMKYEVKDLIRREGVKKIGAGDQYSVLLTDEGTMYVWGSTLPNDLDRIPKRMQHQVEDFEVGSVNILVKLKDGSYDVAGQRGSEIQTAIPDGLRDGSIKTVDFARATRSAAVLTEDGKIITWGSSIENPHKVPEYEGTPVQLEGGRNHIVARLNNGKIIAWGIDNYDVLDTPKDGGYENLYVGYFNNYAMKDEHSYDSWGLNGFRLGTDEFGRDLSIRLIHGGEMTLIIAFVAVAIQVLIGVFIGMLAGFFGGVVDNLLMRFSEIIASFPFYPLIITLSATLPKDVSQTERMMMVMVLLGILGWTGIARLIRGSILAEREKDYITAARALGLKEGKIMVSHMLPNVLSIVIVQATLGYAGNLLTEAGLSFLGFGVVEPFASWGNMMSAAQTTDVIEKYWWRWIFPGLAVFTTALTVNLIGDALRDALDPKAVER